MSFADRIISSNTKKQSFSDKYYTANKPLPTIKDPIIKPVISTPTMPQLNTNKIFGLSDTTSNPNPLARIYPPKQDVGNFSHTASFGKAQILTPEQQKTGNEQMYNDTDLNDKFKQGIARPLDYGQALLEGVGKVASIPATIIIFIDSTLIIRYFYHNAHTRHKHLNHLTYHRYD